VAELAAFAAEHVDPARRADAAAAAMLAASATRVAAYLISVNLLSSAEDARVSEARALERAASAAAEAAAGPSL
jgi:formiminotetrahydrofolate cyclodeaminase